MRKGRSFRPRRTWEYRGGPGLSTQTAREITQKTGMSKIKPGKATIRSRVRFAQAAQETSGDGPAWAGARSTFPMDQAVERGISGMTTSLRQFPDGRLPSGYP